ncbi:DUF1269 domain-containing protein [Chamaesiphon polymorphus]|uniref:DUF1269 domain-containing protein n=1 Tax=Chamaesiphon polymorphus CCALA 037 TaxID=2107692 RepID=A0A2T1GEI8_9CYAN|nr:DUF1269 domain-containing protein [Chamaesiphon polymorphus]PSB55951.1 hypothetical protein C7B77_13425 [Chamaesiphon polymorphus CCALA 037]
MSDLIVIGFKDEFKADEVLIELKKLELEYLIDLEDAAVVVRNQKGKVKIKQVQELITDVAVSGGYWGLLLGIIFLHPILAVFGVAAGAISGALTDVGIDDNFIRDIGSTIEPGTSAIFVLVRKATPDKVLADLSRFEGKVLRTSLSKEDEAKLQAALNKSEVIENASS